MSAAAVPASLILALLSINATQVNRNLSMFSPHYPGMCPAAGATLILNGGAAPAEGIYPIQPRRCAAASAANLLVTPGRLMMAAM